MSTVISPPPHLFCPRKDALELHRAFRSVPPDPYPAAFYHAMKVFGCDKAAVVQILAHRDATQRASIQYEYQRSHSEGTLLQHLSKELSGNLKTSVVLWMHDPVERDAKLVKEGLSSETKNLQAATEVICSRTPSQLRSLKEKYLSKYAVPLEDDIENQASGDHKVLLLACVNAPCDEGLKSGTERAVEDSRALFEAVVGTDEETFINIFSEQSREQLAALISAYHDNDGNSLEMAVKGKKLGLFEYAFWTILSLSKNPARYFAKVLHKAMKCVGTRDTTLIRVIVRRTEIDMQYIKAEYQSKYNKTLYDAVHLGTSGHYRTFLLFLLGRKPLAK